MLKTINRIYQGRVRDAQLLNSENEASPDLTDWNWETALWEHHVLFQDAVNYYLMALFALADESNSRIFPIRRRLAEIDSSGPTDQHVWSQVRRRGTARPGMRESILRRLELNQADASPEDCFEAILTGNESEPALLDLALRELLAECNGGNNTDKVIQKQSKEMFPRFCWSGFSGSYPKSKAQLERAVNEQRLYDELHQLDTDDTRKRFAGEVELGWVVNLNENSDPYQGSSARERLQRAIDHFRQEFGAKASTKIGDRVKSFLKSKDDANRELEKLSAKLTAMDDGCLPTIPKNRKSIPDRTEALLLFKYFPSRFTQDLLAVSFPRRENARPSEKETAQDPFLKFGDDPIHLARGKRGYVFPAFTSLPCWGGLGRGEPKWKKFDIAAFAEALKALHQIEIKGKERAKERQRLEFRLACMKGEATWKTTGESEEPPPVVLKGDPRITQLEAVIDKLQSEIESEQGEPVTYGLQFRTIRGLRDLSREWNKVAPEGTRANGPEAKKIKEQLVGALRDFQRERSDFIGSVRLFEELTEPENWIIWQRPSAETQAKWCRDANLPDTAEFAQEPVSALTSARQMEREIERLKEPIRFTPADPHFSRRQFYFSDVCKFTERGEYRHEPNSQSCIVPLAVEKNGVFEQRRVRLIYSAPRLLRDRLRTDQDENLKSASFLQPMMEALGLAFELPQNISDHAVSLMPEVLASDEKRILLNFPIKLNTAALVQRLGRWAIWDRQFASYDGVNYYLRWPNLTTGIKPPPQGWWWEIIDSFTCLSVDLGQRDAGAFAVLDVRSNHDFGRKPSREIGFIERKKWEAAVTETGLLKLPGEDAKVCRDGKLQTEFYGEKGRTAEAWEWEEAKRIAGSLRPNLEPERFIGPATGNEGDGQKTLSYPEQNNELLRCFRLAQGRLARLQSLSWKLADETRASAAIDEMKTIDDLKPLLESLPPSRPPQIVLQAVLSEITQLRTVLQTELVHLANRILPLRDRNWEWAMRDDGSRCHVLRQTPRGSAKNHRKRAGQRGISLERIEQLEELRRRAQALNRALLQEPGKRSKLGEATRGRTLSDPCPEILDKLERIKEQRTNQTAHLILARALGLRLKPPSKPKAERAARDIHGEYEKVRAPVDFIVLEDLSRYRSSQGRAPRENSRLMEWCHRSVLKKLKELCEPYGIPVVEATAAYSSRFCSRTGVAGFRAIELTVAARTKWPWRRQLDQLEKMEAGELRRDAMRIRRLRYLRSLIEALDDAEKGRQGQTPRTLLAPLPGGPLFIPAAGAATQADVNAAINIGLRAIAAPECHAIQVRIRSSADNGTLTVRADTKRDKARWNGRPFPIQMDRAREAEELAASRNPNFFVDHGRVARFDTASIDNVDLPIASGRGIWGTLRQTEWLVVNRLNNDRLERWGLGRPLPESCPPDDWDEEAEEDDVPYDDDPEPESTVPV